MTRNVICRGVVAFVLIATLAVPGIAAAEGTGTVLTVSGLGAALWDFLTGGLLDEASSSSGGSDTGGDTNNGGGAMDPNGGGTGGTPISPKP